MTIKFTNNATSTLALSILQTDTSLTLATGDGSKFPSLGTSEYFYTTIFTSDTVFEIVKVTARTGDVLTIVRGQEGTSAIGWNSGTPITHRVTAQSLKDISSNVISLSTTGVFKGLIKQDNTVVTVPQSYPSIFSSGVPSSGTIGANGALTLNVSLGQIYTKVFLYFPAGAVYVGSTAGLYYTIMTSGVLGTVYNNKYVDIFTDITSPIGVSDGGPGAYVQTINTDLLLGSFTIPANTLGANGQMQLTIYTNSNTSTNNKTIKTKFPAGTTLYNFGASNISGSVISFFLKNINANLQTHNGNVGGFASAQRTTANTTIDQTYIIAVNMISATDFTILDATTLTYTTQ